MRKQEQRSESASWQVGRRSIRRSRLVKGPLLSPGPRTTATASVPLGRQSSIAIILSQARLPQEEAERPSEGLTAKQAA